MILGDDKRDGKRVRMIALNVLVMLFVAVLSGCCRKIFTPAQPVPVEVHHDTVTVIQHVRHDSIVNHYIEKKDSSSFRQNGDTVRIEYWHWERDYRREKELEAKIDSFFHVKGDSIPYPVPVEVEVPAELTRWQKLMMNLGGAAFYLLIIAVGYGIVRLILKLK